VEQIQIAVEQEADELAAEFARRHSIPILHEKRIAEKIRKRQVGGHAVKHLERGEDGAQSVCP
jgi:hypothetical protein